MTDRTPARRRAVDSDGHAAADGESTATKGHASDETRAVRVRLATASANGTDTAMRIGPGPAAQGVSAQRHADVDGEPRDVELLPGTNGRATLRIGEHRVPVVIGHPGPGRDRTASREILVEGFRFEVEVQPERLAALRERATNVGASVGRRGPLEVRAIIPGKVLSVAVAAGDAVVAGQQLVVVEAMKMQNELRAPRGGTIDRVGVAPGVNIEVGDLLVVISQEATG